LGADRELISLLGIGPEPVALRTLAIPNRLLCGRKCVFLAS
jgi:hypothetical protein